MVPPVAAAPSPLAIAADASAHAFGSCDVRRTFESAFAYPVAIQSGSSDRDGNIFTGDGEEEEAAERALMADMAAYGQRAES